MNESSKSLTDRIVSRRTFIAGLGAASIAGVAALTYRSFGVDAGAGSGASRLMGGGSGLSAEGGTATTLANSDVEFQLNPADFSDRVLVLIELQGGNDGPSTFIPYSQGKYYDMRPTLAIPESEVIAIDDTLGIHPELKALSKRKFAVVEGVGNTLDSLSHFDQQDQWNFAGDRRMGFVAQLGKELVDKYGTDGLSTLSLSGHSPQLIGAIEPTLSLVTPNHLRVIGKTDWIYEGYYRSVSSFRGGPLTSQLVASHKSLIDLAEVVPSEVVVDAESPMIAEGKDLGRQLDLAASLIENGAGVRVMHASLGGFDTHNNHKYAHTNLMKQVDFAVDGFLSRIEAAGMSDRVVVGLASEFGRRATENGGGFDHGNGSTLAVFGPVNPGRYGVPLDFNKLDDKGNFRTEIPFQDYLRTLSYEWLGVESVLPDSSGIKDLIA